MQFWTEWSRFFFRTTPFARSLARTSSVSSDEFIRHPHSFTRYTLVRLRGDCLYIYLCPSPFTLLHLPTRFHSLSICFVRFFVVLHLALTFSNRLLYFSKYYKQCHFHSCVVQCDSLQWKYLLSGDTEHHIPCDLRVAMYVEPCRTHTHTMSLLSNRIKYLVCSKWNRIKEK